MNIPADLLTSAFRSVLEARSATYIASPITGGRRYFEWRRRYPERPATAEDDTFLTDVIVANRLASAAVASAVRARLHTPAIDPAQLRDVLGWTQPDYRLFWQKVIAEFCQSIVLLTGWELSIGCVSEFAVGAHLGLKIMTEDLEVLSASDGLTRIQDAFREIERAGFAAGDIRRHVDAALADAREFRPYGERFDLAGEAK